MIGTTPTIRATVPAPGTRRGDGGEHGDAAPRRQKFRLLSRFATLFPLDRMLGAIVVLAR